MNTLIQYLLENITIDFQGEVTFEQVRSMLREDSSPAARKLLGKLLDEKGIDDMLITLADCLKESLETGVTPAVVARELATYSES